MLEDVAGHRERLQIVQRPGLVPGHRIVTQHEPVTLNSERRRRDEVGEPSGRRPGQVLRARGDSAHPVPVRRVLHRRSSIAVGAPNAAVRRGDESERIPDSEREPIGHGLAHEHLVRPGRDCARDRIGSLQRERGGLALAQLDHGQAVELGIAQALGLIREGVPLPGGEAKVRGCRERRRVPELREFRPGGERRREVIPAGRRGLRIVHPRPRRPLGELGEGRPAAGNRGRGDTAPAPSGMLASAWSRCGAPGSDTDTNPARPATGSAIRIAARIVRVRCRRASRRARRRIGRHELMRPIRFPRWRARAAPPVSMGRSRRRSGHPSGRRCDPPTRRIAPRG